MFKWLYNTYLHKKNYQIQISYLNLIVNFHLRLHKSMFTFFLKKFRTTQAISITRVN